MEVHGERLVLGERERVCEAIKGGPYHSWTAERYDHGGSTSQAHPDGAP